MKPLLELWLKIHPALAELLKQMRLWHQSRWGRRSPYFFPSTRDDGKPLRRHTLTHALKGLGGETRRRTSHSLRAFYVTVRRSEGEMDAVIAAELGDKTGAAIIASTYGDLPPNWKSTSLGKLTWLPTKSEPAWSFFAAEFANVVELPKAA